MTTETKTHIYSSCIYKIEEPDYTISEDVAKQLGSNFTVVPIYAKAQYEYVLKRHYSLNRNKLLECRWAEYKKHLEGRVFTPFQFPDVRDLHFCNCAIRFRPSESIHRYPEYKKKLRPGPGVDFVGQIPIPQELLMKRVKVKRSLKHRCYF